MTRTLNLTGDEWSAVRDGHLWMVRHGGCHNPCTLNMRETFDICSECSDIPADLLAAAAPCETCGGRRRLRHLAAVVDPADVDDNGYLIPVPCPDCRIALLGECPMCVRAGDCGHAGPPPCPIAPDCYRPVVLGYAYPIGEVLPIFGFTPLGVQYPHVKVYGDGVVGLASAADSGCRWLTDDLAHYGYPPGLVGKWALQLAVQP